jgi:hypothetical protein
MNKWSTLLSLALFATHVLSSSQALAVVPPVDHTGLPAAARCLAGDAQIPVLHFDKIIFRVLAGQLVPIVPADAAQLNAVPRLTALDIKIRDNPRTVADLKGKVLTFLGAVPNAANRALILIDDVEYAVICGSLQ